MFYKHTHTSLGTQLGSQSVGAGLSDFKASKTLFHNNFFQFNSEPVPVIPLTMLACCCPIREPWDLMFCLIERAGTEWAVLTSKPFTQSMAHIPAESVLAFAVTLRVACSCLYMQLIFTAQELDCDFAQAYFNLHLRATSDYGRDRNFSSSSPVGWITQNYLNHD